MNDFEYIFIRQMMLFDMTNEVSQTFIAFWELSGIWNNGVLCGLEKYRKKLPSN